METSFPIIGIGASAGGLEALRELLAAAPANTGMAFVVVQHLDPNHESMMAQLLARVTKLPVEQIAGNETVAPNRVYVIPPGHNLSIKHGRLKLEPLPEQRAVRRPIDDFFISLARDQGAAAGCVVVSGTGADGATGLRAIKEHGGVCIVQDPATARYDGMPLAAVGSGLVDYVRPAAEIVPCLVSYFDASPASAEPGTARSVIDSVEDISRRLLDAVGHDFSGYKRATVVRRIERRMQVLGIPGVASYLDELSTNPEECRLLFRDLLINVTRFFRDPEMFEALRSEAIDRIVLEAPPQKELRVWVPGCSSGEEAYSIAMLLADACSRHGKRQPIQVLATDIDERMLEIGRAGRYPMSALADIPEPFQQRYTVGHGDQFAIANQIRDIVRFSAHSLIKDPPFAKIDLVSCRNLLIYFGETLQSAVMPIFQYALRPGGFLFLGPSENLNRTDELFTAIDHRARLFQRTSGRVGMPIKLPALQPGQRSRASLTESTLVSKRWDESQAVRRILDSYSPASILADEDGSILATFGKLSRYFDFPTSTTFPRVALHLARPGLREVLPPLLRQARSGLARCVARDVEVLGELGRQKVHVIAEPMPDDTVLVVIREAAPFVFETDAETSELAHVDSHVHALEHELQSTRHRLRTTIEELETANEELKSSNEEMMSMNEEMQSANEELATVNEELKNRLDQLTVANADLKNFFDSTQLAVVVLDRDLKIRTFTDAVSSVFALNLSDRGRPLAEIRSALASDIYLEDAAAASKGHTPPPREISTRDGTRRFALRSLGYRSMDGVLAGATLVFDEITQAVALETRLKDRRERLDLALRVARMGVWEFQTKAGKLIFDDVMRNLFGLSASAEPDMESMLGMVEPTDRSSVEASLRRALSGQEDFDVTFRIRREGGQTVWLRGLGRMSSVKASSMVGVMSDVSPEQAQLEQREVLLREMNHRVKNLFAIVSAILSHEANHQTDTKALAKTMQDRIAALGRAHSLAVGTSLDRVEVATLGKLVETVLQPYEHRGLLTLSGESVPITRAQITPLALICHEIATNSLKYGVLSGLSGSVAISWRVDGGENVLEWLETFDVADGERVGSHGFGSVLKEVSSRQLGGYIERRRTPLCYHFILRYPTPAGHG